MAAKKRKKRNWIAGAIRKPGAEKRAAKKAGVSTHAYMEKHKNDKGTAGKRARLGLTLSRLSKSRGKKKTAKRSRKRSSRR